MGALDTLISKSTHPPSQDTRHHPFGASGTWCVEQNPFRRDPQPTVRHNPNFHINHLPGQGLASGLAPTIPQENVRVVREVEQTFQKLPTQQTREGDGSGTEGSTLLVSSVPKEVSINCTLVLCTGSAYCTLQAPQGKGW